MSCSSTFCLSPSKMPLSFRSSTVMQLPSPTMHLFERAGTVRGSKGREAPTTARRGKRVWFQKARNQILTLPKHHTTSNDNSWYTKEEIQEFQRISTMAAMAVNDACGDLDIVDHVASCRNAVFQQQCSTNVTDMIYREGPIAKASKRYSESSCELARLHAVVLEKDVFKGDDSPIRQEDLFDIVNRVMIQGERHSDYKHFDEDDFRGCVSLEQIRNPQEDSDSDADESESMGTIDMLLPDSWDAPLMDFDDCSIFGGNQDDESSSNTSCSQVQIAEKLPCPTITGNKNPTIEPSRKRSFQTIEESQRISDPTSFLTLGSLKGTSKLIQDADDAEDTGNRREDIVRQALLDAENDQPLIQEKDLRQQLNATASSSTAFSSKDFDTRCHIAHALISLCRWEFRSSCLPILD